MTPYGKQRMVKKLRDAYQCCKDCGQEVLPELIEAWQPEQIDEPS
jgi:hypothetical protein